MMRFPLLLLSLLLRLYIVLLALLAYFQIFV
jgi:hypothetical protein